MRVILVPVADRPECARALQTAFELGNRLQACVSGCHMRPHRYSETTMSSAFADAAWRKKSTKRAPEAAKSLYRKVAEQNGYELIRRARVKPGALWAERVGSPERLIGIVGPVSDLIVVSRPKERGGVAEMFLKAALLNSSRPVLILPQAVRKKVGRNVCIGWNQSPGAAQTVAAALPILQQANEVSIISCGPEDQPGPKSQQLASYLKHWGINAERVATRGRNVEEELMGAYKDAGADLLLAGAYSRSRWREKVFGGTTEFLVHKAGVPLLTLHS